MTLMNHAGTERVTEDEVRKAPCPAGTKTWSPIPHGLMIDAIKKACDRIGVGVVKREYSMSKNGLRLFGTWQLDGLIDDEARACQIGFRQGLDKKMAIGICAGLRVFVCDNMMFDGEFIAFRMHTSRLDGSELLTLATRAVNEITVKIEAFRDWHDGLKQIPLEPDTTDFKELTYDAMTQGVFSPGQLGNFLQAYREERTGHAGDRLRRVQFDVDSLYTWHAGAIRLMRGWSMLRSSEANRVLNGICDNYAALKAARVKPGRLAVRPQMGVPQEKWESKTLMPDEPMPEGWRWF